MVELIGFQNVNFTPKDSNDEIKGLSLFVVYPKDHVTGKVAEKIFVSEKKAFGYLPKLGDHLDVFYNRYGKVESIALCK